MCANFDVLLTVHIINSLENKNLYIKLVSYSDYTVQSVTLRLSCHHHFLFLHISQFSRATMPHAQSY